jgi:hypothetical protein
VKKGKPINLAARMMEKRRKGVTAKERQEHQRRAAQTPRTAKALLLRRVSPSLRQQREPTPEEVRAKRIKTWLSALAAADGLRMLLPLFLLGRAKDHWSRRRTSSEAHWAGVSKRARSKQMKAVRANGASCRAPEARAASAAREKSSGSPRQRGLRAEKTTWLPSKTRGGVFHGGESGQHSTGVGVFHTAGWVEGGCSHHRRLGCVPR